MSLQYVCIGTFNEHGTVTISWKHIKGFNYNQR